MALHAKAKVEAGYRFYALYDKISREDILAHAWAQCVKQMPARHSDAVVRAKQLNSASFMDVPGFVKSWVQESCHWP